MAYRTIALALALAGAGFAQAADQTRVFRLAHIGSPQQIQELVNSIRAIGEIRTVAADATERTVAVSGTADQIAFTAWIVAELDKPAAPPRAGVLVSDYLFPDPRNPAVKVFYPAHIGTPQAMQELVNTLRSIAEAQRVTAFTGQTAIVMRATADQASLAEWLVRQADDPAPAPMREMVMANWGGPYNPPTIRVFHPAHITQPQQIQEMVNAIRSIAEVQRVVAFSQTHLIVLRGQPEQAVLGGWLIEQVDSGSSGVRETRMPGWPTPVVRAYSLPAGVQPQEIQTIVNLIRTVAQVQRVVAYTARPTILLRGSDEQVAAAAKLMTHE